MTTQSQNTMVRKQLEAGGAITPIDALNWFGIMRLGARIYDLRQSGLSIKTEIIHKGHKHFARYTLLRSEILETGDYDIHIKMKPNRTIKGTLITGKEDNRKYCCTCGEIFDNLEDFKEHMDSDMCKEKMND